MRFKTCQYCHAIFGGRGMGEGGALLKVYQLKIMPIISYIAPKGYLYPIPRARSNYTLKPVKSVIIIYTSKNNKPLHHAVGSPMNPLYIEVLLILTWLSSCCSLIIIIIYNLLKPEQNFLMSISFML